jgi:Cullin family
VDKMMNDFMDLFRLIRDKDVFGSMYVKSLSKRVLWCKNLDEDAEKKLVSRLKIECGGTFTKKMETIFFDFN